MQFCIEEWESGQHEDRDLDPTQQERDYNDHLEGLEEYAKVAGGQVAWLQSDWFKFRM
jgi:hypothetical protein